MNEPEESPAEIERQRDAYRTVLLAILVTVVGGGFLYWLMGALR